MTEGVVRPGGSPLAFPEGKAGRGPSGLREEVGVPRGPGPPPAARTSVMGGGCAGLKLRGGLKQPLVPPCLVGPPHPSSSRPLPPS